MGWMTEVLFPGLSLRHSIYRMWSPPSIISNVYKGFYPRVKAAVAWNWTFTSI